MLETLLVALGLVLIIEGLMPLLGQRLWRDVFSKALQMTDGQLRFVGLASVLAGLVLLTVSSL